MISSRRNEAYLVIGLGMAFWLEVGYGIASWLQFQVFVDAAL